MHSGKNERPTLSWPGKPLEHCREVSPLLALELHRERNLLPAGWRNLLIHADNLPLLSTLSLGPLRQELDKRGGVKLIYCDPPFAVGADFSLSIAGKSAGRGGKSDMRLLAYKDQWEGGLNSFLSMMYERLLLMRSILAPEGSIYLHCDHRTAPHLRLVLDEIFGPERFLGDIVWHYTGGGRSKRWFSRKHDRILHYAASAKWIFNADAIRVPYKPTSGYAKGGITSAAGKHYSPNPLGTAPDDVWDIPMVNPLAAERCGYPTQKPLALLERVILASSRPGDIVADFFCGSGTTLLCAERLGRFWIGVDSGAPAIHTARKRLSACKPNAAPSCEGGAPYALCRLPSAKRAAPGLGGVFRHAAKVNGKGLEYEISGVRLRAERLGAEVTFRLEGFEAKPLAWDASGPPLPREWREWLDYWSIGLCRDFSALPEGLLPEPLCAATLWESFGSAKAEALFESPPLEAQREEGGEKPRFVATLVDVFANESRLEIRL